MTNPFDYNEYLYKKQLSKDSNAVNLLLIIAIIIMNITVVFVMLVPAIVGAFNNIDAVTDMLEDTTSLYNMNSLVMLITFFVPFLVFCWVKKVNIGTILPFEKVGFKTTLLITLLGFSVAMVANYPANIIAGIFEQFGLNVYPETESTYNTATDIILGYVNIALVPAFIEEFAFRGVVLGFLRKHSDSFAVVASAILFGLFHGNFVQIPFAFIGGLMFGFLLVKTNSLLPGMIVHFINNAFSVTLDILVTSNALSENSVNLIYTAILIAVSIIGIICAIILVKKHQGFFILSGADDNLPFKEKIKTFCTSACFVIVTVIFLFESVSIIALA